MSQSDQVYRQLALVTAALISGVVIFAVVVVVLQNGEVPDPSFTGGTTLRLVAAVFGIGILAAAPLMSSRVRGGPGAPTGGPDSPAAIVNSVLIAQGMRDAVGMLGGMVGFLTGDLLLMGALVAAAVASMVVGLPSRDEVRRRLGPGGNSGR